MVDQKSISKEDSVDLIEVIESKLESVHTQSLDLSFNELMDMHAQKELDITPDYQRLFQWSEGARSRFIESLLLEMPVPPIYVVEEDEGRYLLIDGLQRISSYLHLRGTLSAEHLDPPVKLGEKLVLSDCDIVTELNGRTYDELPTALQIRLKRAFVRVEVIRKGSDARFKYHMFKRLNAGGQLLSPQQLRNCTIRLLDARFNDFIVALSQDDGFREATDTLTRDRILSAFDQELVLRFFALKNWKESFKHDVGDFLTEYMERVSDPEPSRSLPFNYPEEEKVFRHTFGMLAASLREDAFAYANPKRAGLIRGFSVYHFEAFTIGLQPHVAKFDEGDDVAMQKLGKTLTDIKMDTEFIKITTGGGKNSPGPLQERIAFVEKRVGEVA